MTDDLMDEISPDEGPTGQQEVPTPRRALRLAVTGLAAAAVAGVAVAGVVAGRSAGADPNTRDPAVGAPAAATTSQAAAVARQATPRAVLRNGYRFQNQPQTVETLAAGQRVKIARYHTFQTRGTQWSVTSHQPREPSYEPFGWRATVGNSNLGNPGQPSLHGAGSAVGLVFSSVFKSDKVSTVVYTRGKQAWYGKLYRLAGIPGWVQSSIEMKGEHSAGGKTGPESARHPALAVFSYDKDGRLLSKFPAGAVGDPLAK
jgi:hypothetical protein